MPGHRRGIDEVTAFAVRLQPVDEGAYAVHHAVQVDAEHPVPVVVGHLVDAASDGDAGVVAHHVHVAETRFRRRRRRRHVVAVGYIHLQREKLGVARLELVPGGIECRLFDVGDHYLHAGRGERPRHGEADAACAAGDECSLARYLPHARPLACA